MILMTSEIELSTALTVANVRPNLTRRFKAFQRMKINPGRTRHIHQAIIGHRHIHPLIMTVAQDSRLTNPSGPVIDMLKDYRI